MKKQLTQRQEAILLSLKKLDFLNRDQLQTIHRLGQVRNANRILKSMNDYLESYRDEYSTIYYLNSAGREYVDSNKVRRKNQFVNHVIMRNYFYIFSGFPSQWNNEMKISDGKYTVICDSYFKGKDTFFFLEVDSMQKMKENRKKIEQYKGLFHNGAIAKHFGHFPPLLWVTTTELRRKQLSELCDGLPFKVYTENDIK
ncbi:replication-relaxation family protein [Bacillus sp. JJ722]|uniref:replication-relaxation family protein n=1 Tax=Bacillus sp. JJ722 TaxID=3122973 RepID=UPI003000CD8D